jgi:hypothetical protein
VWRGSRYVFKYLLCIFDMVSILYFVAGIGQAPVKGLAVQLAAIDIIEKIKYYNKDQKLQTYGMPPGCRVHPHVLRDLMLLCKSNEIMPKIEFRNSVEPFETCELFECTITVGQLQLSGCSLFVFKNSFDFIPNSDFISIW